MSKNDRDLRMVLVAFEDAATWCETLADLTDEWLGASRTGKRLPEEMLKRAAGQVAETRRYLESNRREIGLIKHRAGLA
jgi:hypothetical protein